MFEYKFLFPYKYIPPGSTILLYGTGIMAREYLTQIIMSKYCNIIGFVAAPDQEYESAAVPIYSATEAAALEFDFIVIAWQHGGDYPRIVDYLSVSGIPKSKIVGIGTHISMPYQQPFEVRLSNGHDARSATVIKNYSKNGNQALYKFLVRTKGIHQTRMINLMGGLCNQIYQYIFAKYIERKTGNSVYFDDLWFFFVDTNKIHNGVAALDEVFPVQLNRLSRAFPDNVWQEMLFNRVRTGAEVWQQFWGTGVKVDVLYDELNEMSRDEYDSRIFSEFGRVVPHFSTESIDCLHQFGSDNCYYAGYWQYDCMKMLKNQAFKEQIVRELTFPALTGAKNQEYARRITEERAAAVHIRRGDFVTLGWDNIPSYYRACIQLLEQNLKPDAYYIFSDDIEHCMQNQSAYGIDEISGKAVFVDENHGKQAYQDLHLMTLCKYLIPSLGSSFSKTAKILAQNEMIVVSSPEELEEWYL